MALSYGATFISTSAIVGFGGAAGSLGMGVLWLTFLNIFFGIFIAFVIFGKRTRKMGHNLDAHTFPELLSVRYRSRFMQGFAGIVFFSSCRFITAAVIKGRRISYSPTSRSVEISLLSSSRSSPLCLDGRPEGGDVHGRLPGGHNVRRDVILLIFYTPVGGGNRSPSAIDRSH